jgi:two-component system sensor histidine kinase DegS
MSLPSFNGRWSWFWPVFYFEFRNHIVGWLILIPMVYTVLALGWKKSSVIALISLVAIAPYILHFTYQIYPAITSLATIIAPYVLVVGYDMKLTADRLGRVIAEERRWQKAEVLRQRLRAQEEERKRIAQELHDGIAQELLIVGVVARELLECEERLSERRSAELEGLEARSLSMVAEIRRVCRDLRPSVIDQLGLLSAVKWLMASFREQSSADVRLIVHGAEYTVEPEQELGVFRIIQEALNNCRKHADASRVAVTVSYEESNLVIHVEDNGQGFAVPDNTIEYAVNGRLGLLGMRERAQAIGAELSVKSSCRIGTRIVVVLPRRVLGRGKKPQVGVV